METRIERIGRGATVGEAVEILLATSQDEFPIVDGRGRLTGLLSRASIVDALKEADPGTPIAPFAQPDPPTIFASEMLDTVLKRLGDAEAIGVLDAQGAFVGLITRQSIAEVMLIKTVRPEWRFARRAATAASL
jgi:stage IV sporulation protein FB